MKLNNQYYGSFNVPFFDEKNENVRSYIDDEINYNPRKYIVDNLIDTVRDLESFKNLLTYNGFLIKNPLVPNDPSYSDPSKGIASRGEDFGAIDFKVVDNNLIQKGKVYAYVGPHYQNNRNFKPFKVQESGIKMKKYTLGYPEEFNFRPEYI